MNLFLIFIAGVVGGVIGMRVWGLWKRREIKHGLIARQAQEKEENKRKIMEALRQAQGLKNDEIQKLLGISDATATRYLEELEKEGLVRQVGGTGSGVYYERTK